MSSCDVYFLNSILYIYLSTFVFQLNIITHIHVITDIMTYNDSLYWQKSSKNVSSMSIAAEYWLHLFHSSYSFYNNDIGRDKGETLRECLHCSDVPVSHSAERCSLWALEERQIVDAVLHSRSQSMTDSRRLFPITL